MTKKIFRSIYIVAIAVFLAAMAIIIGVLYSYFTEVQFDQLEAQVELAAHGLENEGMEFFGDLNTQGYRLTWIDSDGTVLYDTDKVAADMDNHIQREEVEEALESGYGQSERYSDTFMEQYLYVADRLEDGSVIRGACVQNSVLTLTLGMLQPFCVIILAALVLSIVLASRLSQKIVAPLNELDLDNPLSNEDYDELSPLLRRIDSQQRQLRCQAEELTRKQEEWTAVTDSMNEGLILLGSRGRILSINRAAANLLETSRDCVGRDILTVSRSLELQEVVRKAGEGQRAEKIISLVGGSYELAGSPVFSGKKVSGVALLLFDVTEKEKAEQMRREFTANVSHELKTPLHTISGCAELLKNGLVKQEDISQFSGTIYTEAQRMIRLVEDIIRLSRLDEGAEQMQWEQADLYQLAEESIRALQPEAKQAGVTLKLEGQCTQMRVIPHLASGILYNLCDNAIKYNSKGGNVTVTVQAEGKGAKLSVSDTGIGIPPEDQNRIFERFYRVDKSRSKEVGGTGLGLSIVKHAVRVMGARIELHSILGEGTTITVHFPGEETAEP